MPESNQIPSFCNRCQRTTRHSELFAHPHESRDGDGPFPRIVNGTWSLLECLGCGSLKVLVIEQCADFKNPRETHYPSIQGRAAPAWEHQLTSELRQLIRETYCALNSDCPCLAAMGTRALIDMVLTDLV